MKNTPFREILKEKNFTLDDLIKNGIPRGTAKAHYYGVRNMTLTTAKAYAFILGIPLNEFITLYEQHLVSISKEACHTDA